MEISPRAAFVGTVNLDGLRSSVPRDQQGVHRVANGLSKVDIPGTSIVARDGHARIVLDDSGLAIVRGDPILGAGSSISDAQLLGRLRLGEERRDEGEAFRGRFSIVFIDFRRRAVVMRTDRFAVFPICYSVNGRRISFSDRADAVPRDGPARLDHQALFNYFYFHVVPAPRTVFEGVSRVEPARAVRISNSGLACDVTWKPKFLGTHSQDPTPPASEFLDLLRASVEVEADGAETGAYLSGGTDSSTIAGMLAALRGSGPKVFSIGFEAEGYDEIAYARIAATHFQCDHHVYYVTPSDVIEAVPRIAAQYDQPFGNSSALPAYYCAQLAKTEGVGKLLAGDGGDEIFGGNTRYAKQKVFEAYAATLPAGLGTRILEPLLLSGAARGLPLVRKASSYIAQARIPMPDRAETYNLLHRHGAENLFTRHFLASVLADEPENLQRSVYGETQGGALVDRMLAYDWRFTLADNDLPKVVETATLAGERVAFPLLDDRLVDLSLRLSVDEKVKGLTLRHWFKESLRGFLPDEILRKKKHGFGLPFGPWLIKHPALQRLAMESVDGLVERGLIQPGAMSRLFSPDLERFPGYYGEMIWILMMAEQWLRRAAPEWQVPARA